MSRVSIVIAAINIYVHVGTYLSKQIRMSLDKFSTITTFFFLNAAD